MSKNAKYCESCGGKNKADAKFCDDCGKPFDKPEKTTEVKPSRVSEGVGLEVVSLISSILGLTCCLGLGLVVAIITGLMAPKPKENKYAKVGITIGSLGLIVPALVLGFLGIIFGAMEQTDDLIWMLIMGIIALILAGVGLFFFIRWIRKPAA